MDASCSSASNCGIITYYKFNKMKEKVTLVVVDFQYDFCLLGAPLYVPGSDKALWNISHLIENNKVALANAKVQYHTIYSSSVGVDVQPDEQVVICGLAGDFCVLETLKNLAPVNPMIFLDGVASLDGGVKLNEYVESNGVRVWS